MMMFVARSPDLIGAGTRRAGLAVLRIPLFLLRFAINLIMFGLGLFLIAELLSAQYLSAAVEGAVLILLGVASVFLRRLLIELRR